MQLPITLPKRPSVLKQGGFSKSVLGCESKSSNVPRFDIHPSASFINKLPSEELPPILNQYSIH